MKTLDFNQMEKIEGGGSAWDYFSCGMSIFGMVTALTAVAAASTVTGGAAAIFAIGWLGGGVSTGVSCGKALM